MATQNINSKEAGLFVLQMKNFPFGLIGEKLKNLMNDAVDAKMKWDVLCELYDVTEDELKEVLLHENIELCMGCDLFFESLELIETRCEWFCEGCSTEKED